jgi:hypothetical protein
MEDDYYFIDKDEDKYFNLHSIINFWIILGLVFIRNIENYRRIPDGI